MSAGAVAGAGGGLPAGRGSQLRERPPGRGPDCRRRHGPRRPGRPVAGRCPPGAGPGCRSRGAGPCPAVGVSTHSLAQARAAADAGADYIGFGPVSHPQLQPDPGGGDRGATPGGGGGFSAGGGDWRHHPPTIGPGGCQRGGGGGGDRGHRQRHLCLCAPREVAAAFGSTLSALEPIAMWSDRSSVPGAVWNRIRAWGARTTSEQGRRMPGSTPIAMGPARGGHRTRRKQPEECPKSLPKEGETCPGVTRVNIACRYAVRQCPTGMTSCRPCAATAAASGSPCGLFVPCSGEPASRRRSAATGAQRRLVQTRPSRVCCPVLSSGIDGPRTFRAQRCQLCFWRGGTGGARVRRCGAAHRLAGDRCSRCR